MEPALTPTLIGTPRSLAARATISTLSAGPDIAGVDPQLVRSGFQAIKRELVVEMDVGDDSGWISRT